MAKIRSQFQTRHMEGFGGSFVDSQMLANAYDGDKPHVFEGLMGKIFTSSDRFTGKSLLGMTLAKGKVKEIDNEVYRWKMRGAEEKALRVVENLESTNTTPGINGTTFRIKLDEGWFHEPDVIFGESNKYALEIVGDAKQDGNGYIYTVRLQTEDSEKYFPQELMEVGREFNKVWTTVSSEYNEVYGTQQTGSTFEFESQIGYFAQELRVTDRAFRRDGYLGVPVPVQDKKTGKQTTAEMFMPMAQARMKDELYMGMEAQLKFGERTTKAGPQGYWTKTGPGLRQMLSEGHIMNYSGALSENMLKDYLMDIFISRVDETDRKIVATTGTGGAIAFHDMLAASAASFFTLDTHFITKQSENPRLLSYGAQFTHYQGPEGLEVTLVKDPMNDNFKYCPQASPTNKKLPVDSFRFTFMDFGTSEGESNIQFLKEKNSYVEGYVPGTWTPSGPITGGGQMGSSKNGCDFFCQGSAGIWMKDTSRGGEIILDVEL